MIVQWRFVRCLGQRSTWESPMQYRSVSWHANAACLPPIFRCLGPSHVKGYTVPVMTYEVLDAETPDQRAKKVATGTSFENLQTAFHEEDYKAARVLAGSVLHENPEDGFVKHMLQYMDKGLLGASSGSPTATSQRTG